MHISKNGSTHHLLSSHVPKLGNGSPKGCGLSPKGSAIEAKDGAISPKGGTISPKGGTVSPKGGIITLKEGTLSPKGLVISPKNSLLSTKVVVQSSKSGSHSPRNNSQSPKTGQHSPRSSRPHSPKGRPQSPKGRPQSPKGGSSPQKLKRSPDNNNHGGIYKTLHVDVDLANNKLTLSPVDGRRCHSDSRLSVKKSPRSIPPSDNKKRKLEFTDIKSSKRTTPPGKKRRTDGAGNNSTTSASSAKRMDGTIDHNQNIQVVGNGKRRNSWDNTLHSPDQYKSDHCIGSRKAVLKVATYSDTILTSTRRSLPACTASCVRSPKAPVDIPVPGVQLEALDLSVKSPTKDQLHSSTSSVLSKPQTVSVLPMMIKTDLVAHGESETSSVESDPTDKYEKVDMEILFKKDAIANSVMIDDVDMDHEINSTKDVLIPRGEVYEDGSDKDKRSMTPESEGDDSAFSTVDTSSVKGKQPKRSRVAKKYVDLQPREPRKRRMASLTAETKNLILFDKDITAPVPKSPVGDKGKKRKRKESLASPVSAGGSLLQASKGVPSSDAVLVTASTDCDALDVKQCVIRTLSLDVSPNNGSSNSCLDKNVKKTQSVHPQASSLCNSVSVPKPAESPARKTKLSSSKKDIKRKNLDTLASNPKKNCKHKDSSLQSMNTKKIKRKDLTLAITSPKKPKQRDLKLVVTSPKISKQKDSKVLVTFSSQKNKDTESTCSSTGACKTPDTPPSATIVSSSPSKSAQLLLSRRATVDSADLEKLNISITSTTSITSPLLLRMSRHSTDGTNSGDESSLPSPALGFMSTSLLRSGKFEV